MAVLLVALNVMAVMMLGAMPVWRQLSQREKEEELIFRGRQYARAVGLYERKFANAPPPSFDVLVQQKFLRKKFKDPITNQDFVPITAVQAAAANAPAGAAAGRAPGAAEQSSPGRSSTGIQGGGGVIGVTSRSTAQSIRIYNGRTRYNEWTFVYAPPALTPGAGGGPGAPTPGQRGQPPQRGGPAGGPIGPGGRAGDGRGGAPRGGPFGPGGGVGNPSQPPPARGR